jgi:hypothetical protein
MSFSGFGIRERFRGGKSHHTESAKTVVVRIRQTVSF